MITINATKEEFVNLVNGLFAIQELKGKKFSLVVSKNITILRNELKELEEFARPSEEFLTLAHKVNAIADEDTKDSKERIDKLEEENKELVKTRKKQMDEVSERIKEEIAIDLHSISENILPEDITAKQINQIQKIIE